MPKKPRHHASSAYKSGLEVKNNAYLKERQKEVRYEVLKIEYLPTKIRSYKPDFLLDNGIIIETKGYFENDDRQKHLIIKEQHPELDIRFVFSRASTKITPNSKTTYGAWCDKHGFLWAEKFPPEAWLDEPGSLPTELHIKLKEGKKSD